MGGTGVCRALQFTRRSECTARTASHSDDECIKQPLGRAVIRLDLQLSCRGTTGGSRSSSGSNSQVRANFGIEEPRLLPK